MLFDQTISNAEINCSIHLIESNYLVSKSEVTGDHYIHHGELTYSNKIIFKDVRMVVPKLLCNNIKQILHISRYSRYIGHLVIAKTKIRACKKYTGQESMETENIVNRFENCQEFQNRQKDK